MPFSAGVFSRLYNWVTDASNSIPMTPSRFDQDANDMATGLSNCVTRNGQSPPTTNLPMGGFKLTGLAAGTNANDSVNFSQLGYTSSASGGIPRTSQSKFSDWISVLDFGADPTGTFSSDTAFSSWASAIAGGKGIIPPGSYKLNTGNIVIQTGTTIDFMGASSVINYTGTGSAFLIQSAKNITLNRPRINLSGFGAKGIDIQGGWFLNIINPSIGGSGSASNQISISIVSSQIGNLGFGSYMIEIHNPDFTPGAGVQWGIKTGQTASDTVYITHLSIYGGWSSNTPYPLYYRGVSTFRVTGYTPEQAIDGINMSSCHDGFLSLGEIDCTGYGHNFPDTTCSNITIVAPSHAGSGGTFINRTFYTPAIYDLSEIRLLGNTSVSNYFYSMVTSGSYGSPLTESAAGGGVTRTLRTYGDGIGGQQLYYTAGISSTGTAAANLRGNTTFSASNSKGVGFTNTEADTNFYIALSGNAAGYCWVSAKSTTGFTITCSAVNSNSMDWILIR